MVSNLNLSSPAIPLWFGHSYIDIACKASIVEFKTEFMCCVDFESTMVKNSKKNLPTQSCNLAIGDSIIRIRQFERCHGTSIFMLERGEGF
jgi:hypothetical protein